MRILSKKQRSILATLLGLLTSVATAFAVIDFNTFDIKKDWLRLIVIGLPAAGGFMSSINQKDKDEKVN